MNKLLRIWVQQDPYASIGTYEGKESVIGSAIWLVGNCTLPRANT